MKIFGIIIMKWRIVFFCGVVALAGGCAQLGYYFQAAHGQLSLLSSAKPIEEWLADPGVGDTLKDKLAKTRDIRRFAAKELNLPDNGTFTTYADVNRPFVLWNVVATPELSLTPKLWCFPIAGCVNYRGYYKKEEAQAYAVELRNERFDVQVSGVPAYSTLGWFNDPVLSTFIQYPEAELARLIFHELAHQVVYISGDSGFNESFAVAVEEAGIQQWVNLHGNDKLRASYREHQARKRDFLNLLVKCRRNLEANYASDSSDADKRKRKAEIFRALQDDYQLLKESWRGYAGYDRWFAEPLSNAHLALIATYHDYVPGFRALLAQEGSYPKFYSAVQALAALEPAARKDRLMQLAAKDQPGEMRSVVAQTQQ